MIVVVGSTNPVKVAAAEAVLRRIYGPGPSIDAQVVDSGVDPQPWGADEAARGAINRARAALASIMPRPEVARLGIGFEGGLIEVQGRVFTCAWCAVARHDGALGIAGGESVLLPPQVAAAVRAGEELGPAMDALTGRHNTKQDEGAIGILTDRRISRQAAYEHLLTLALARMLTPAYYEQMVG